MFKDLAISREVLDVKARLLLDPVAKERPNRGIDSWKNVFSYYLSSFSPGG